MSSNLTVDHQKAIPLDFDSAKNVPESYVWLQSDEADSAAGGETVPLVDLKDPEAAKLMRHACETWGVFQLINHGVPLELLQVVESESRKLFHLPLEQKLKILRTSNGGAGYGVSRLSQFFDKKMWFEGFTIKASSALYDHAKLIWPNDYQRFCGTMEECMQKMKELVTALMCSFLKSIEVADEKMIHALSSGGKDAGALQLNSYPPCPYPDRVMGLAPHSDTSLFTVLYQGTIGGLQVFKEGLGWVAVKPISGALVVNIGDLLHILSNGRFHNVVHRVAMKEAKHRISIAYFHTATDDFPITPLVLRDGEVPVYRSVTAKKFVDAKFEGKDPEKVFSVLKA